jgi:hypothetical protein
MGADFYFPFTIFGYKIQIPSYTTYAKYVNTIWGLNGALTEPFEIIGILPTLHSRMECADYEEYKQLNKNACLIIGFKPSNDLEQTLSWGKLLAEYITDNPILDGIDIDMAPQFYSGINWTNHIEMGDDSDSDNDSDDDDDNDDDDNDDDDVEDEDEDDEDDDEDEDEDEDNDEDDEEDNDDDIDMAK